MTRTKRVGTKSTKSKDEVKRKDSTGGDENYENTTTEQMKKQMISLLERQAENQLLEMEKSYQMILSQIKTISMLESMSFTDTQRQQTVGDYRAEKSISSSSMFFDTGSVLNLLSNTTKNGTLSTVRKNRKNTDDEAESNRTASGDRGRASRKGDRGATGASRLTRTRSLSRNNITTPIDNRIIPSATYGMVTPKVKPNMPMAVLRRPKQGEMAISMQGSPLMVSGVVSEQYANVNIPLADGRVMSLQPSAGLRLSQIPDLDDNTRRQLLTLRDNINKVVHLTH